MGDETTHDLHFKWSPELVQQIAAALSATSEIYDVSARLKTQLPESLPDHVKAFVRALDYYGPAVQRDESGRDTYGPQFTSTDGYAYPEPLSLAASETRNAWRDALHLFGANDVVAARLNDLLWCVKNQPRPDLYARAANSAFRRLWRVPTLASVHRSDGLVRALEIAIELRDTDLVAETMGDLVAASRQTLADDEWEPGVAIPMIEALAGLPGTSQPRDLPELLDEAKTRYADDPFIVEAVLRLLMQRAADAEERRRRAAEAVSMWRQHAEERGGLVGLAHLERALELARNEGVADAVAELRVLLQQPKTADELGMTQVGGNVTIPREVVEGFIGFFVETSGAEESLIRLAAHSPIRDIDADTDYVVKQIQDFPLQHFFSTAGSRPRM